jgi:hypothetical protein
MLQKDLRRRIKYGGFLALSASACVGLSIYAAIRNDGNATVIAMAVICGIFAVIAFTYGFFSSQDKHRAKFAAADTYLKSIFLQVLLTVIDFAYMPAIHYSFNSFQCARYTCPPMYVFNPFAARAANNRFSTSESIFCDKCALRGGSCASATIQTARDVCPGYSELRIWRSPEVSCDDRSVKYFRVSSLIVLASFIALVPALYFVLIRRIAGRISADAVIVPDSETCFAELSRQEEFEQKITDVDPVAASFFSSYYHRHRYFKVVDLLLFRVTMVFVAVVVAAYSPLAALLLLLLLHTAVLSTNAFFAPYSDRTQQRVATAFEVTSVVNVLYALMLVQGDDWDVTQAAGYIVLALNFVLPIAAGFRKYKFLLIKFVTGRGETTALNKRQDATKRRAAACVAEGRGLEVVLHSPMTTAAADEIVMTSFIGEDVPSESGGERSEESGTRSAAKLTASSPALLEHREPPAETELATAPTTECNAAAAGDSTTDEPPSAAIDQRDGDGDDGSVPLLHTATSLNDGPSMQAQPAEEQPTTRNFGVVSYQSELTHEFTADDIVAIHANNENLRGALNTLTSRYVMRCFCTISMLLAVAFACSLYGITATKSDFVNGSAKTTRGIDEVLGGYETFQSMYESCCCLESTTPSAHYNVSERWVCPREGVTVTRGRQSKSGTDNGLPLRPVCGGPRSYRFNCSVGIDEFDSDVVLKCGGSVPADVTGVAQQLMF